MVWKTGGFIRDACSIANICSYLFYLFCSSYDLLISIICLTVCAGGVTFYHLSLPCLNTKKLTTWENLWNESWQHEKTFWLLIHWKWKLTTQPVGSGSILCSPSPRPPRIGAAPPRRHTPSGKGEEAQRCGAKIMVVLNISFDPSVARTLCSYPIWIATSWMGWK